MSRNLTKGGGLVRIKDLRVSNNLTQKEFSDLVGVKRTTVTMWEKGKSNPGATTLKKISRIFNCSIDDLI